MIWRKFLVITIVSNVFSANDDTFAPGIASSQQGVENGISAFALNLAKLMQREVDSGKNVLFSPLNLYTTLALVHLGSDGNTHNEISQLMKLPIDINSLQETHKHFSRILSDIRNSTKVTVEMANGIFVQNTFPIKKPYLEATNDLYGSETGFVDFATGGKRTLHAINEWISNKTKRRIKDMFKDPFDPLTAMILASSIYFNGEWKHKFTTSKIKTEKFQTSTEEIEVPMMKNQRVIPYVNNPYLRYEAISMPYDGEEFAMCIILPYANTSIQSLIQQLDVATLQHLTSHIHEHQDEVNFKIPKLKFDWKKDLVNDLRTLGVRELFAQTGANLGNMMNTSGVYVSKVTHAAEIEIHESGTVASAVTVYEFITRIVSGTKRNATQFFVTRPFVFLIFHQNTNTILFMGLVNKPT